MSLGTAGAGLALIRAGNGALGFILSVGLAGVFGASRQADALFVAMGVAVFLARDLARVVRVAAVPCFVEHDAKPGSPDFPSLFHCGARVAAAAGMAALWIAAPGIVAITSPGFDPSAAREAVRLLRLLAPSLPLFLLFGSVQAAFHARRMFLFPEFCETAWRGVAIAALFTLGRRWGVEAYAWGLLLAALVQWALLAAAAGRAGVLARPPRWTWPDPRRLRPFWVGAVVVLCSVGQVQIEAALDRAFVSFMAPGSIALFNAAERLAHMLPLLLSTSLLAPWLPEMARIRARVADPRRLAKQGSLFLAGVGALLGLMLAWAARDIVEFLLLRGRLDASAAEVVIRALRAFALGIPAIFCVQCLAGLYIIERNLKGMAGVGAATVLVHAAGNLALRPWGVPGVALAGSLSIWFAAAYLWRRIPTVERVWFDRPRFAGGLAAAGALLFGVPWAGLLPWAPLRIAAGGLAAWAAYVGIMGPAIRRMREYECRAVGEAGTVPATAD